MTLKQHSARVMGVFLESISEHIYSIGEDKRLKIHDLRKNALVEGKKIF